MILIGWSGGQFARPSDYEILSLAVEVSLSKWKWVEGVKELRDVVDAQLDCVPEEAGCHHLDALEQAPINTSRARI